MKDDPALIEEYKEYHRAVWPEVLASLRAAGIRQMEIFLLLNRLVMVLDVDDSFSLERKAADDLANPKVQEWEGLMRKYQQALPGAKPGEKWKQMESVFFLAPLSAAQG